MLLLESYDNTNKDSAGNNYYIREYLRRLKEINSKYPFHEIVDYPTKLESFHRFLIYMNDAQSTLDEIEHFIRRIKADDLTEEENSQVDRSRKQIKEGKSKRFKNVEEYLKSLDEDE
jgi:hypothetical protein